MCFWKRTICFLNWSDNMCLLIGVISPHIFNEITKVIGFKSPVLVFCFILIYLLFASSFLLSFCGRLYFQRLKMAAQIYVQIRISSHVLFLFHNMIDICPTVSRSLCPSTWILMGAYDCSNQYKMAEIIAFTWLYLSWNICPSNTHSVRKLKLPYAEILQLGSHMLGMMWKSSQICERMILRWFYPLAFETCWNTRHCDTEIRWPHEKPVYCSF